MGNYKDNNEDKENKKNELELATGRWTNDEHLKFVDALKIYGKNWKKVGEIINTRTTSQIRSHAQKYFNKLEKKKQFQNKKSKRYKSHNSKEKKSKNDLKEMKIIKEEKTVKEVKEIKEIKEIKEVKELMKFKNIKREKMENLNNNNLITSNNNYNINELNYKESLSDIQRNKKSNSVETNNNYLINNNDLFQGDKFNNLIENWFLIKEEIDKDYNLQKKLKLEKNFSKLISQFKILFKNMIDYKIDTNSSINGIDLIDKNMNYDYNKEGIEQIIIKNDKKIEFKKPDSVLFYINYLDKELDEPIFKIKNSKKNSFYTDELLLNDLYDKISEKESLINFN